MKSYIQWRKLGLKEYMCNSIEMKVYSAQTMAIYKIIVVANSKWNTECVWVCVVVVLAWDRCILKFKLAHIINSLFLFNCLNICFYLFNSL